MRSYLRMANLLLFKSHFQNVGRVFKHDDDNHRQKNSQWRDSRSDRTSDSEKSNKTFDTSQKS